MEGTAPATEAWALEVRTKYVGHVNERLSATMNSADRFVNFSGLIAAAAVTAGIVGNEPLIAILAPYALTIVFAYQVQLYTDAERLVALLEHLESDLNKDMHVRVFATETIFHREYRNRWSVWGMQLLYGVVLTVAVIISAVLTQEHYGTTWLIVNLVALLACLAILVAAVLELSNAQSEVRAKLSRRIGQRSQDGVTGSARTGTSLAD